MLRALMLTLLLAGSAAAQPAAPAPAGGSGRSPESAAASAATDRPASAPASSGSAAPARIAVRVPSGSEYTLYIEEAATPPKTVRDRAELEVPAGLRTATLYVLDPKSGYAARKSVEVKGTPEVSFAAPDFQLVQKLRVVVTGKDSRPVAAGVVTLTDREKRAQRELLQPAARGVTEFELVAKGPATLTVLPEGGSATTKEVTIDLPPGETAQTIPIALPEVTATVDPGPEAAASPPAAGAETDSAESREPEAAARTSTAEGTRAPEPLPAPPTGLMAAVSGFLCMLFQFAFLAALVAGGLLYARRRGVTLESVLKKMGVQPDTVPAGDGAAVAARAAGPAPVGAPAPPPIVADPNQCPYCGAMKDASGRCACEVTPGAMSVGPAATSARPAASGGPRLVGTAGTYFGEVFPLSGTTLIGREPTNTIPLDRDTTASRRHAQITEEAGGFRIQDLGSSNGTFVNGQRVTEALLRPGDEVSIGGTRFRFEV